MMEDGLFAKYPCDAIFAMHNIPGHPQGKLLLRDGAAMASSDRYHPRRLRRPWRHAALRGRPGGREVLPS